VKFWDYGQPQPVGGINNPWTGDGWVDLQGGFGHTPSLFGPELSFGHALKNAFSHDDIYLIKEGLSSTNLAVDWNPNGTGPIYTTFKARVDAAMANLTAANLNPTIAGMIWMQGENDAINSAYAGAYATNLADFIAAVRSDFDTPDMPFVLGRILPYYDTAPAGGNTVVRTAQVTVAGQTPHVSWIDTDDLQLAYVGHYGTQGQIDLGTRFADALIAIQTPEPSVLVMMAMGLPIWVGYSRWQKRRLGHV
jgi:hypothetical protein